MQLQATLVLHLDAILGCRTRCRTTDVERTHGQLSTWFTDGLCRDNTNRFTFVHQVTTGQVTTVALRTHTEIGVTGNHRTNQDAVDRFLFDQVTQFLIQQRVARDQNVCSARDQNVFCCHTAQYTLTQRLFHVAAFDQRSHDYAFQSAAIVFGDHQVLRYVYQTTSQVTGVRCLQCGIRQTFTRTVSRDEVLQYVQTFTEVRGDWGFDDGAIWLRHQTTHTRQLTHLCSRTTRTGVGHHKYAVEGRLLLFFAVTVSHGFSRQVFHHGFRYFIVGHSPDIDHLVVTFAGSYQTRLELLLNVCHFRFRIGQNLGFRFRDNHVVDTNGHAGTGCVSKTGIHDLVSKHDGRFQTQHTVAGVQHTRDRFLTQRLVNDGVRQTLWNDHPQDRTTYGSVDQASRHFYFTGIGLHVLGNTNLNARMQLSLARAVQTFRFFRTSQHHAFAFGVDLVAGHVVQTQYHVLRRHDDWITRCRRQDVVG